MNILLWISTALIALVIWLYSPDLFWRYIFFLRVPILAGLLLVALPLIATRGLRAMLRNLFVLRGRSQLIFVIISSIMAGTAVVLVANIILQNAPDRFGVPLWFTISQFWQYLSAIALALPICITAFVLSREQTDKIKDRDRLIGVLIAAVVSLSLLFAISFTQKWLAANIELKQLLLNAISLLTKSEIAGYVNSNGELAAGHLTAFAFFLVGLLVYSLIGLSFQPKAQPQKAEAPALLYLMLIISMSILLLGGLTFFFDFYRVPLLLFLILAAVSYALFNVEHVFDLKELPKKEQKPESQLKDFGAVLEKRLQHQSGERTLVIVCASGGGIQAAGWTVEVLTGLQKLLGESFAKAIGLISSVSGGSVGTMYYLDRFNLEKHIPEEQEFAAIFKSTTRDSLDAVGWGLAYPDLWRIGLPFLSAKLGDRGTAVEKDWQGEMKEPKSITSLNTWRSQVLEGKIPIPIFNTTLVENGRRFLISPMTFGKDDQDKFLDFNTLYQGYDINVVTAARLSASFPYISPVSRSNINLKNPNHHIVDGGYFDNSGVFTMVEWLNKWLESEQNHNIKRVMLLQISAFPKALSEYQDAGNKSWFLQLVGPLLAVFKVRDSTLMARNDEEIKLLCQRWKDNVDIKHFSIYFPSSFKITQTKQRFPTKQQGAKSFTYFFNKGKYQPPLSWRLSDAEKQAIKFAWKEMVSPNAPEPEIKKIIQQWSDWGMAPKCNINGAPAAHLHHWQHRSIN